MQVGADGELAQAVGAQVAGEVHPIPDGLFDQRRVFGVDVAGHP